MATTQTEPHILLITGTPGIGKTTVLRKVAEGLGHVPIGGFFTEEIREQGSRRGFRLIGFGGEQGIIAHVDFPNRQRVGKYGVDIGVLERLARITLALHEDRTVYLVDEIGKMECLASGFVTAMRSLLESDKPLVATIGKKGSGLIDEVKRRGDVKLVEVTHSNRDSLPTEVLAWLARHGIKAG